MCLFSESREVLGVNVVNISAVLLDLRLINLMLELFLVLTKCFVISSSRSNYAITMR
jgi:hypothetical protein